VRVEISVLQVYGLKKEDISRKSFFYDSKISGDWNSNNKNFCTQQKQDWVSRLQISLFTRQKCHKKDCPTNFNFDMWNNKSGWLNYVLIWQTSVQIGFLFSQISQKFVF